MVIKDIFHNRILRLAALWLLVMTVVFVLWPQRFTGEDMVTVYLEMAEGKAVITPFAYRVLVPAMVGLLPLPPKTGFLIITLFSTFFTLVILYRLFRAIGISHGSSLIAVILAGFSYPLAFYLGRWWRIDPFANLLFVLGLLLIIERKLLLASATITFGVLAKETLVILIPILFFKSMGSDEGGTLRRLTRAALLCLAPGMVLMAVRLAIPPSSPLFDVQGPNDYTELWKMIWASNVGDVGLFARIARELLRSYGILWPMALLGLVLCLRKEREIIFYSIYLIAAGFALCLVASDWSRMLGTGFPGIFILVGYFVDGLRRRHAPGWIWGGLIALAMVQSPLSLMEYRTLNQAGKWALAGGTVLVFILGTALVLWAFWLCGKRESVGEDKRRWARLP
jgi:hypothetical protein